MSRAGEAREWGEGTGRVTSDGGRAAHLSYVTLGFFLCDVGAAASGRVLVGRTPPTGVLSSGCCPPLPVLTSVSPTPSYSHGCGPWAVGHGVHPASPAKLLPSTSSSGRSLRRSRDSLMAGEPRLQGGTDSLSEVPAISPGGSFTDVDRRKAAPRTSPSASPPRTSLGKAPPWPWLSGRLLRGGVML